MLRSMHALTLSPGTIATVGAMKGVAVGVAVGVGVGVSACWWLSASVAGVWAWVLGQH